MKTYQEFMTESVSKDELAKIVHGIWNKYFKNAGITSGKTALKQDNYAIYSCRYGKDKKEFKNGISQNDPLSLMITVTMGVDKFVIEYPNQSITIKPTKEYMAFGSKKIGLRKTTVKNIKMLEKNLDISIKKVHTMSKDLLKSGELDIHGDEVVKMIKSKV